MPRIFAVAMVVLLTMVSGTAQSFWSVREIAELDGYSELDGVVKLKFKDTLTAKGVSKLTLTFDDGTELKGNADGVVQFPFSDIEDTMDSELPFTVSAPGYIDYRDRLRVQAGTVLNHRFVVSPILPPQQARFVIEWGKKPSDLDGVLKGPNFEVSYRSKKNAEGNARLDRDARSGFGPETLTLLKINPAAEYVFSVNNYSKDGPMDGLKVSVYINNALERVIYFARTTENRIDLVRIHSDQVEVLAR